MIFLRLVRLVFLMTLMSCLLMVAELLLLFLLFDFVAQLSEDEVILQPLILVLVPDKVSEELPVAGCIWAPIQNYVVLFISKIRQARHAHYGLLYVLQFEELGRVRHDVDLGFFDF